MKLIKYISFVLLFSSMMFISCTEETDDVSSITSFAKYGFSGLPVDVVTVSETAQTLNYEFTLGNDQITDVSIDISPTANSVATENEDFSLSTHRIDIPALGGEGSFSVSILKDYLTEGDETFGIELSSLNTHGLPEPYVIEFLIEDVINDEELVMVFDWDGEIPLMNVPGVPDGSYGICANGVDIDVYVLDSEGNDLGIYDAATGACPETIIVDSSWEDGTYYLASNMWANGFGGLGVDEPFILTFSASKQGNFNFSYKLEDNWRTSDLDQTNGGNVDFKEVGILTVVGSTYTVTAPDGTLLGSGFKAPNKNLFN